jgi:hypothetical protein
MTELGWMDYPLPSRGVLYEDKLPGGRVSLHPMTAKEQSLLQTQGGGVIGKLDALIATCCKLPQALSRAELLLTDRLAILLTLRTKTFGPEYSFQWRCKHCAAFNTAKVDIVRDLEEKTAPPTLKEPIEVTLPQRGCVVAMRFLRGVDEETLLRNAKRLKMQSNDGDDQSYLMRVAMQLVTKDGEPFGNILDKQRFVENLSASDLVYLEDEVSEQEPGIDTRLYLDCSQCSGTNEMGLPFTAEFFRPRRTRSSA